MIEFIFVSILFLFAIYISFKSTGLIAQGIGEIFTHSKQEMKDIETAIRAESRKKMRFFAGLELFLFIPIWIFFIFFFIIIFPEMLLFYIHPDIVSYFPSGYVIIVGISGFILSAMVAAYTISFIVRGIYKIFHPSRNSMIMFYNSFELYNISDPDDDTLYYQSRDFIFIAGAFTALLYVFCLGLSYIGINTITSTHYHDNHPVPYMSEIYNHEQLNYTLESKEYSDGIDYTFIVGYQGDIIAKNRLADEIDSKAMREGAEKLRNLLGEQLIEVKK